VAASLCLAPDDGDVLARAGVLWSFVHGHCFLTIDQKSTVVSARIDDWTYLTAVSRAVLG
jgi:hypothetical protein